MKAEALQPTDEGRGGAWFTEALVVIGAELPKGTVVLEEGENKDLVSDGDDGSFASAFRS